MPEPLPPAPELPGFSPVRSLGRGGFATVYLYEQRMPKREVAVKILSTTLRGDATVDAFEAEANLLASVSSHPAIVTIHGADISAAGHPFIVMEHCPRPNLHQRIQRRRSSVPEALRIAIQLCGAVETAHRAGILHRDIKPANVLFTSYDHPALADFGIAGALTGPLKGEVGLSVPWSPPEAFDLVRADVRLDVYALGATLYAMLAGHAPYHRPGDSNGREEQEERIRRGDLPRIDRDDLPASLVAVVERALSGDRAARPSSALELGRDLQRVQAELALDQTPMDVVDHLEETDLDVDETRTRLRASEPVPGRGNAAAATPPAVVEVAREPVQVVAPASEPAPETVAASPRPRRPSARALVLIGVVAGLVGLALLLLAWIRDPSTFNGLPDPTSVRVLRPGLVGAA